MAFSNVAKLGAGTKTFFQNPANPGVWKELTNALEIGQVGEQGEFLEVTPLSEKVKRFIRGMKTPPQKQMTFNDVPANVNYAEFESVWDDEDNVDFVPIRIDYSNGRRAEYNLVQSGRVMDGPEGGSQLKQIFFAQQDGSTTWGEY